jgi:hypothetical protein
VPEQQAVEQDRAEHDNNGDHEDLRYILSDVDRDLGRRWGPTGRGLGAAPRSRRRGGGTSGLGGGADRLAGDFLDREVVVVGL